MSNLDLSDPGSLRALLSRHGVDARKGLGQHFLCSASAVRAVLDRLEAVQGVLEIGPGPGALTGPMSERSHVIALEIDDRMRDMLGESAPKAEVRHLDALTADLSAILNGLPAPRAVVSNLPYYITGPLVSRISEARGGYAKAVLMMQKEVAKRFVAPPGDRERGSISVYLQAIFDIRKVADVPPGAFLPPPKVDSTILEFIPNGRAFDEAFFRFVRIGFTQPRKTLANNLGQHEGLSRDRVAEVLGSLGLSESIRPHQLGEGQWVTLYNNLF